MMVKELIVVPPNKNPHVVAGDSYAICKVYDYPDAVVVIATISKEIPKSVVLRIGEMLANEWAVESHYEADYWRHAEET